MTPEQFIYWLQGYIEMAEPKQIDEKQIQIIKDHIALVLKKETPDRISVSFTPSSSPSLIGKSKCILCGDDHGGLPCTKTAIIC